MSKHSILVVESDRSMQSVYNAIFRRHETEFKYHLVQSGEAALKFIEQNTVDLMLLAWDLPRPGIAAADVLELVRAETAAAKLPVVVLSPAAHPAERAEAIERGASHYQGKDCRVDELLAEIRRLLNPGWGLGLGRFVALILS
jgi:DNA-binding response OmpR family regulator